MANPCSGQGWQKATAPFRNACALNAAPCALCGKPIDYTLRSPNRWAFTVDHIVARWAGGQPLDPRNWQPAHQSCNSSRGARENNRERARLRPKPIYHLPRTELTW